LSGEPPRVARALRTIALGCGDCAIEQHQHGARHLIRAI